MPSAEAPSIIARSDVKIKQEKRLQESAANTGAPAEAGERTGADIEAINSVLHDVYSVKKMARTRSQP